MRGGVLLAVAVLAWLVAIVAWVGNDPQLDQAWGPFSTYNTSPDGMSLAFAYLMARHGAPESSPANVRRLVRDVSREPLPSAATIFKIGPRPDDTRTTLLSAGEEGWIRSGGRLVIGLTAPYAGLATRSGDCTPFRSVFPISPPLPEIDSPNCRSLAGAALRRFHSLVINDHGPVVARWPLGTGEVIAFSMPEAISNQFLDRPGNLELLERLAGSGRTVLFDETAHGIAEGSTVWHLLTEDWRLGPAMVLLGGAAVASFWRRAKRVGPPERPERDVRSEAVDLVQSLGQLYDRSVNRGESLRLYYQGLVRAVHERTGLSGEPLERLVRKRTKGYDPRPRSKDVSREEFQRMLAILNQAYETVGYANTR
ncbi:MAG TPA: DUF4350 domain-containing protein [Thermoanaerobaculia bacterium]|nr:DUF4350 domain-containing protein [Thermoanaerobaculia bacterium]